ncbi:GerAB/ArcD/ProY family transporter [Desulforamulus ferrireducens]|uniref:Uncharacterized protein n=1 Tax=Desulforamulus ferrireducens TaxID=1833852 RepID=A0A1S6ISQ7_9FIRM|nr:GerAB/ArcD/ProY family transporter [Desulforamulus ferrireducens]AQS57811.1 hypothetical protein B0537_01035 [Desulforamulus ferrireducens]
MNKETISPQQLMLLVAGFAVGTSLLFIPTLLVKQAKQDALLATALTFIPGMLLLIMLTSLNKWYPGQSIVQYSVSILGLPGKIIGLIFIFFAGHLSTLALIDIGIFINLTMLAETPTTVIYLTITAISAYALFAGLETMARALSLLLFLVIVFSVMFVFFTLPGGDFTHLLPLNVPDWPGISKAIFYLASFPVGECVLFGMIFFSADQKRVVPAFLFGQFISAAIGSILMVQALINLGVDRVSRSVLASVSTINSLPGSNLLLIPLALTWFVFTITKFIICYYAFVLGLAHWTGMSDYRPLVLPAGALIISISLILFEGVGDFNKYNQLYDPLFSYPIEFGLPLILWLTAGIKLLVRRRG